MKVLCDNIKNHLMVFMKKVIRSRILMRNFLILTVMEICLVIILTYNYIGKIEESVLNEMKIKNQAELMRSAESLDFIMEQMIDFAYYISVDDVVKDFMLFSVFGENSETVELLKDQIQNYCNIFEYVDSIYVYSKTKGQVMSSEGIEEIEAFTDRAWLEAYEGIGEKRYVLQARRKNNDYPFLLSMVWPVNIGRKEEGAVIVNINIKVLGDSIGRSDKDMQTLYMTDFETLYFSNVAGAVKQKEVIIEELTEKYSKEDWVREQVKLENAERESRFVINAWSTVGDWCYVLYCPLEDLSDLSFAGDYIRHYVPLYVLAALVISLIFSISSYWPIRRIMVAVREEDGIREPFLQDNENEVQYITNLITNARRKNKKLELEVSEWRERLGYAQIQALQSQIEPHALYNTLDTINWMAKKRIGFQNEVSDAICALANLLRISLKRTTYLISLEEELEHARMYVELLYLRYPDKLKVHWEIDEKLYSLEVVRLSLQPILENAIIHGLRSKKYKGNIYIRAQVVNHILAIQIEDDGKGMSVEECRKLNHVLNTDYMKVDEHVGIKNVNQRLKILFGEDYGIQVCPREEGGLIVYLLFPM